MNISQHKPENSYNYTPEEKWYNKKNYKKSSITTSSIKRMKICQKCDIVFELRVNHPHQIMETILLKFVYCTICKERFTVVNCTCNTILSGNATLPEYILHNRYTIQCENCNRYLIFQKEDFPKFNWESYTKHYEN